MPTPSHVPVLLDRVVALVAPALEHPGSIMVDATLGLGGHTEAVLERCPQARVIGIDRDVHALERSRERLAPYAERVTFVHAVYDEIGEVLAEQGLDHVDGVLFDLGVSSMQLDVRERGFAYAEDAPLDMRFSTAQRRTASEIVNRWSQDDLAAVLWHFGEEKRARRIAEQIVTARPIRTVGELTRVIEQVAGRARSSIHPATKTFQALRIAVNEELEALAEALRQVPDLLASGGRLVVISFHSLEDRMVKERFRDLARDGAGDREFSLVNKKPIEPSEAEMKENPRARSAKLRVLERVA